MSKPESSLQVEPNQDQDKSVRDAVKSAQSKQPASATPPESDAPPSVVYAFFRPNKKADDEGTK
jgi:hypothetical protein